MQYPETLDRFMAHPDKGEVSAVLLRPEKADWLLVLGHGAGAGMRHANMEQIAQGLADKGIATYRYQFPFMERGGGRDALKVSLATVQNAVAAATRIAPDLPLLAGGHSFGGRMTSLAAAEMDISPVKGLIFFAFPLHAPGRPGIERAGHLADIPYPMLFLSGDRDTFLSLDLFKPLIKDLGDKATLHLLDTAGHGYKTLKTKRSHPDTVFVEIATEARKWLDARQGL